MSYIKTAGKTALLILVATLCGFALMLGGCADESSGSNPLVGTWVGEATSGTVAGITAITLSEGDKMTLIITTSSFSLESSSGRLTGTFEANNDGGAIFNHTHLNAVKISSSTKDSLNYTIVGKVVTFTNSRFLISQTFTKQ